MRRVLLPMVWVITGCLTALAQDSAKLDRCLDQADTQLAMNMCADQEVRRVEAELNLVYQELLLAAHEEPGAVKKIEGAERAWTVYRDAYLEAMYPAEDKIAAYGSIFPTEFGLLRARLTRQQTDALRELLKHYSGLR